MAHDMGSPEWFNFEVFVPAVDRIMAIIKPIAATYLKGGYPPGYVPLSIDELKALDPPDVAKMLGRMASYPQSDADATKLLKQYLPWIESQGLGQPFTEALLAAMMQERGMTNG